MFPRPPSAKIDTLLLGCTHYPLLRPVAGARRGRPGRDRRLGDGHRRDARRAAASTGSRRRTTRGPPPTPAAGHDGDSHAAARPAHDRRRRALPRDRRADVRRVVPGRGAGRAGGASSDERDRRGGERRAAAGIPRRSACWQVGFVVGSAARGRGHGRRPADRARRARRGPRRLAPRRGHRDRPGCATRPGTPDRRTSCAPTEAAYAAAMAKVVPAPVDAPRHGAAGGRRPGRGRRPGGLGPRQHRRVRRAHRARSRASCWTRCSRAAAGSRRRR